MFSEHKHVPFVYSTRFWRLAFFFVVVVAAGRIIFFVCSIGEYSGYFTVDDVATSITASIPASIFFTTFTILLYTW